MLEAAGTSTSNSAASSFWMKVTADNDTQTRLMRADADKHERRKRNIPESLALAVEGLVTRCTCCVTQILLARQPVLTGCLCTTRSVCQDPSVGPSAPRLLVQLLNDVVLLYGSRSPIRQGDTIASTAPNDQQRVTKNTAGRSGSSGFLASLSHIAASLHRKVPDWTPQLSTSSRRSAVERDGMLSSRRHQQPRCPHAFRTKKGH